MRRTQSLFWQLYPSYLVITIIAIAGAVWYMTSLFTRANNAQAAANIEAQAKLLASTLSDSFDSPEGDKLQDTLQKFGRSLGSRITLIRPNGSILADSFEQPEKLNNLLTRPEVQGALEGKTGFSSRFSIIYNAQVMYKAVPVIKDGSTVGIVRVATREMEPAQLVDKYEFQLFFMSLVIAGIASVIGLILIQSFKMKLRDLNSVVENWSAGNLKTRIGPFNTEEFSKIAENLNSTAAGLQHRIEAITKERNELQAVLSNMMEAVIVVDTNQRVINVNQAAETLFNIKKEAVTQRTVQEAIRNTDLHKFISKTLDSLSSLESELTFLGDPDRYFQAHGAVLLDSEGNKFGGLIVLNDITRQKTAENIRKDFVANVSHELKTPITTIKGFLETLKEGAIHDSENVERFLQIIIKHTDRLHAIIEDLLSLSRIERDTEKGEINLDPGNIKAVVLSVVKACTRKASLRSIEIKDEVPDNVRASINAPLLEQAIINLVDNAIKYSESGQTVLITAETKGSEIAIQVADSGCGISKEHLSRIFERFYRVDKARSRNVGGTGLGLSIVKHIVKAHNGRIEVTSSPFRGSTFTIFLPVS